jgi:hypothetical protein
MSIIALGPPSPSPLDRKIAELTIRDTYFEKSHESKNISRHGPLVQMECKVNTTSRQLHEH